MMLQQTQTHRVVPKFEAFVKEFPSFEALAHAPLKKVLTLWQGLGYNRRALYLKRTAEVILREHAGKLPRNTEQLVQLPGVGSYTAGAIRVFAFDEPAVFIETNIRAVFLYFFFPKKQSVPDSALLPLIKRSLPTKRVREWYSALMDYGAMLKQKISNPSQRSLHYYKQSTFKGSFREKRAGVLRAILAGARRKTIPKTLALSPTDAERCLRSLEKEGLLKRKGAEYTLTS